MAKQGTPGNADQIIRAVKTRARRVRCQFFIYSLQQVSSHYSKRCSRFSGVSFTQTGFTIKGKNMSREFNYDSIVSGEVLNTVKGRRLLQLSLKNVQQPVTLEVFSFNTFRVLLTQMTRRGISIKAENEAGRPGPSRMM